MNRATEIAGNVASRFFGTLMALTLLAFVLLAAACDNTVQETRDLESSKAHNAQALKSPEFVGCLPDGRALFRLHLKGPDDWSEDRVYITLDGQATTSMTRRHGKSYKHESVAWPIPNDVKPDLPDPCLKETP